MQRMAARSTSLARSPLDWSPTAPLGAAALAAALVSALAVADLAAFSFSLMPS